jgi:hypothetical protein
VRAKAFRVDIDRIVLTGLEVTPDRAEHIRILVETGLQRQLQREGLPQSLRSAEVGRLHPPEVRLAEPQSDSSLAGALTKNISNALRNAGPSGSR